MMREGRWLAGEQPPAAPTDYERGLYHGQLDALEHVVRVLGENAPAVVRELLEIARMQAAKRGLT